MQSVTAPIQKSKDCVGLFTRKRTVEKNRAAVSETSIATSKLNDNTTQMSVPTVGNKSLSSYEYATKLGPSDSLITSLSWVCLCCLNWCLLGPIIPPCHCCHSNRKPQERRRLWILLSMSSHLRRPTKGPDPAGPAQPRPVHLHPMLGSCQLHTQELLPPRLPPHFSF